LLINDTNPLKQKEINHNRFTQKHVLQYSMYSPSVQLELSSISH